MKIILALIVTVCLFAVLLAGCDKTPETTGEDTTSLPPTEEELPETETEPPEPIDPDYLMWMENARAFLLSDRSGYVKPDAHLLAWGMSYEINSYCQAYKATGDRVYLEKVAGYIWQIYQFAEDKTGEGYRTWGTDRYEGAEYEVYTAHTGVLLATIGEFINLVYSTPSILTETETVSKMTYDDLCQYLIKETTEQMIPYHDADWNEELQIYMNRPGSFNYDFATKPMSLPANQYICMAETMIQFAKLSPAHEEEYLRKAKGMLNAYKEKLVFDEVSVTVKSWMYHEPYFKGDHGSAVEDYSHAVHGIKAAMRGYANGLVFSNDDFKYFANTYETTMRRGTDEEPTLTSGVDGSGTKDNALRWHMYDLSIFGPSIWWMGKTTAVYRDWIIQEDASRILIYHENAPTPLKFSLIVPKDSETVTGRILFRWEVSAHACKYTLQISDNEDFSNLLLNRENIIDTSAFVDIGLPNGTLYWRVISANQSGKTKVSNTFTLN